MWPSMPVRWLWSIITMLPTTKTLQISTCVPLPELQSKSETLGSWPGPSIIWLWPDAVMLLSHHGHQRQRQQETHLLHPQCCYSAQPSQISTRSSCSSRRENCDDLWFGIKQHITLHLSRMLPAANSPVQRIILWRRHCVKYLLHA